MHGSDLPKDGTGEALRRLRDAGSDLTKPMTIDFCVAVPNEAAGMAVAEGAAKLGYKVDVAQHKSSGAWTCYCTRTLVPSYSAVVDAERTLDSIGRAFGGYADGFGSFGNVEQKPRS